jgi:prepilin-type N-terminal cleavage/methylation domain-containing protein
MMGIICRMSRRSAGFSLIEALVVMLIVAIVTAIALPSATNSLKGYHLHSDATSIASYLNVVRMKSASQYAPYRLVVDTNNGSYVMERLCGNTPSAAPGDPSRNPAFDANCAGVNANYQPFATAQTEGGTQYVSTGDTFSACRPANIAAASYPGTIAGDPGSCASPVSIYFNTRGSPVDNTGAPLGNGGAVVYIQNQNKLTDGITVSPGGRVSVSMWTGSGWAVR